MLDHHPHHSTLLKPVHVLPVGAYDPDQPGGGFLDILKGGTERFLTNIKDTSSKVIQSVARYRAPVSTFIFPFFFPVLPVFLLTWLILFRLSGLECPVENFIYVNTYLI